MKANKGEWSEFYALLKILEDRRLFVADKDLNIIADKFFVFQKIIRNEINEETKIFDLQESEILILDKENRLLKTIQNDEIKGKTIAIFEQIKNDSTTTFAIPEAQNLMHKLLCKQIKASNSKKSDIDAIIYDRISNKKELLGFSIKSMIGGASTLLNAGKTTNLIYRIDELSEDLIKSINNISDKSKIQNRLKIIVENGGKLKFTKVLNSKFEKNLRKIDTVFPIFLSLMLLDFFMGKANKITDLVNLLVNNEELRNLYRLSRSDYEYKVKNLLVSIALGMIPSKEWDGFTKAHGGYIVVKQNGDVVCYHLYNRDEFVSYLYENTRFESASSARHDYGEIYIEEHKMYINLNVQIRFTK